MTIKEGQPAPDFTAPATSDTTSSTSNARCAGRQKRAREIPPLRGCTMPGRLGQNGSTSYRGTCCAWAARTGLKIPTGTTTNTQHPAIARKTVWLDLTLICT